MWVFVSYNRCLYQDGDWREDHFAELENGMLVVYAVSKAPSGRLMRVRSVTADDLEITVLYDDDNGASRSVVLLAGSARSKDLWVKQLSDSQLCAGPKGQVTFESVVIKSPTKDESLASPNPSGVRKRESITGQWDLLTSFMGSWHRRLFRLFQDGSMTYHEVVPVACVSLSSASSMLCMESSPKSLSGDKEIWGITLSSSFGDASLPKPPAEPIPPLNSITRRLSRAVGSFSTSKAEEGTGPSTQGWSTLASAVTIGTPSKLLREKWFQEIQQYSAWFSRESLADSSDTRRAKVIMKGWGWKKGQMSFSAWKLRFFVLLSNRELVYYEAEIGREPLGIIDLRKKKEVRLAKSSDRPQGFEEIIEIETASRTWYFSPKALTRGEHAFVCNQWLQAISESNENFEKHHSFERKESFVYSTTSFFVPPTDDSAGASIPIVHLNSWQRMTGNVPSTMLSPSPSKVEFLLHGVAIGESTRRRSILNPSGAVSVNSTDPDH